VRELSLNFESKTGADMGIKQRRTDQEIIQRRAVETREKIMASAIDLYIEKGYHKATVDEIAKHAGVSTGIAYRYFKNKKELLLEALAFSFEHIAEIAGVSEDDFLGKDVEHVLTAFERIHTDYREFHEELEGLRHSDSDVKKLYEDFTESALRKLHSTLPDEVRDKPHSWENLNMAISVMENYCHAYMDKSMSGKELKYMRQKTIELVGYLMIK
jgi:AcrR family transcriptional regulator